MNEQNVVYTYEGVLFSLKKEGNSDTCYTVENIMLNEISQSQKEKHYMTSLP